MNALNAYNKLNANVAGLKKASEKLSSGYRINRAGDDAAGLAISEKMRSQIRGLNQAKRNAQDGISMIQTFEGAAQETHTILQRMKELATESANGTYDNATDRAAIQLEFDQLNDELNQLADTDFNGTIVLNGGTMSDGLEEVDGTFDYKNKQSQLTQTVTDMLDKEVAKAEAAWVKAQEDFDASHYDLSEDGAPEWTTVDGNHYDRTVANTLWKELGLTVSGGTNVTSDVVDLNKGKEVSVTFKRKSDGTWEAASGTVSGGSTGKTTALTTDQLDIFTAHNTEATDGSTDTTGEGGFYVTTTNLAYTANSGVYKLGNAVFEAHDAKESDTVTLVYTNDAPSQYAPKNVSVKNGTLKSTDAATGMTGKTKPDATKFYAKNLLKDDEMTQKVYDALEVLKDANFKLDYEGGTTNGVKLSLNGSAPTHYTAAAGAKLTITKSDGSTVDFWVKADAEKGDTPPTAKFTISTVNAAGSAGEVDLLELNFDPAVAGVKGTLEGTLAIEDYKFSDPTATSIKIDRGDDPELENSAALKTARDEALTALNAAKKNRTDILTAGTDVNGKTEVWDKVKDYYGTSKGVSVSDAFDHSTAIMTYAENIILQTGARSKDAVNFTFNYNKADMGDLEANLNLSSRANGLNTENLSLATADDANYAIDQIDKAINKTSMVRASFGAIQNRLDYKIENLTTTSENLTEAESNIRDTDMANEMLNYTKFNILQQAAQSMLAQANQQPQSILQLLG